MLSLPLKCLRGKFSENASLAHYTSWRTGGPAEFLYIPKDIQDLSDFLAQIPAFLPITFLGLGSNTLIRDGGIDGVVIVTQGALSKFSCDHGLIKAEAGVSCAQLARYAARLSLTGLEFMAGIPGTVGGALAMNAGCFGGETWQYVTAVETINRQGRVQIRQPKDFSVSYRSVLSDAEEWFVAGHFLLASGEKDQSLNAIRSLLEKRNLTQPTGTANCGSVFRNPAHDFAGRLIEQCGLKGKQHGGACVSEKHANFIINKTQATSADIEYLIAEIKTIVEEKTGVRLTPEVKIIGRSQVM